MGIYHDLRTGMQRIGGEGRTVSARMRVTGGKDTRTARYALTTGAINDVLSCVAAQVFGRHCASTIIHQPLPL